MDNYHVDHGPSLNAKEITMKNIKKFQALKFKF